MGSCVSRAENAPGKQRSRVKEPGRSQAAEVTKSQDEVAVPTCEPYVLASCGQVPIDDHTSPPRVPGMDNRIGRKLGELLVISYDLGTTASGCAYMHRDADNVIDIDAEVIDRWPGQGVGSAAGKTPSVLLYNDRGECLPEWGAQAFAVHWTASRLASQRIRKVEWYKLHIDPECVPPNHLLGPTQTLPPGITAWQVYTDYLGYLHEAAMTRFETRRGADLLRRLRTENKVQYILTIPAAWQRPSIVGELRRCAVRAGLVPDADSMTLDFCTEPEASALECFQGAPSRRLSPHDVFTILDAGGGTVDFTTYQVMTVEPTVTMMEVDVGGSRCLYRGGTFVDKSFENLLRKKMEDHWPDSFQEHHVIKGVKHFTTTVKLQFSASDRQSIYIQVSEGNEFDEGCVEFKWSEIETCFKPHVDAIVDVARQQVNSSRGRSKVLFCSGGFGSNDYLRQRLGSALPGIEVLQPGDKSAGSKAVSLGATRYGMFRSVVSRVFLWALAPAWYGAKAYRKPRPSDQGLPGAMQHTVQGKAGGTLLSDTFSTILAMGDGVKDDEWRTSQFTLQIPENSSAFKRTGQIVLYESSKSYAPAFVDEPGVRLLCKVDVVIPSSCPGSRFLSSTGLYYTSFEIKVLLSLGRADLRTRVMIDGIVSTVSQAEGRRSYMQESGSSLVTWSASHDRVPTAKSVFSSTAGSSSLEDTQLQPVNLPSTDRWPEYTHTSARSSPAGLDPSIDSHSDGRDVSQWRKRVDFKNPSVEHEAGASLSPGGSSGQYVRPSTSSTVRSDYSSPDDEGTVQHQRGIRGSGGSAYHRPLLSTRGTSGATWDVRQKSISIGGSVDGQDQSTTLGQRGQTDVSGESLAAKRNHKLRDGQLRPSLRVHSYVDDLSTHSFSPDRDIDVREHRSAQALQTLPRSDFGATDSLYSVNARGKGRNKYIAESSSHVSSLTDMSRNAKIADHSVDDEHSSCLMDTQAAISSGAITGGGRPPMNPLLPLHSSSTVRSGQTPKDRKDLTETNSDTESLSDIALSFSVPPPAYDAY